MQLKDTVEQGFYRHYKGDIYRVVCTALHSETQERLIVYQNVSTGALWVRPEAMFVETVDKGGQVVPRFAKMDL